MGELALAGQSALLTILYVAGPILAAVMAIGLVVSLFQAVTQINEATLSFVPKFLGTALVLALLGPWMLRRLEFFTIQILAGLPRMLS